MDDGCPKRFDIETVTLGNGNGDEATRAWKTAHVLRVERPSGPNAHNALSF